MTGWIRRIAALIALAAALAAAAFAQSPPATGYTTGRLLVAAEDMADPRFARTVVFMVEHDADGAFGLVVNKPLVEMPMAEFVEAARIPADRPEGTVVVHFGGPVGADTGFVLHPAGASWDSTVEAGGRYAMSSAPDAMADIADGDGPARYVMTLGHAGWAPGQLDRELGDDVWAVVPATDDLVFADDPDATWKRALARRGIEL